MLAVFAGGAEVIKVELASLTGSDLGGPPPLASHVLANASRLVVNDVATDKTRVHYSDTAIGTTTFAGHEVWGLGVGTAGYFTAEARPDEVLAIAETTNEIFVFGKATLELWAPDSATVYSRVAVRDFGCSAGPSVMRVDDAFAWLDHKRRFVQSDGRSMEVLSDAIQRTLDDIEDVSDCFGYRVQMGPIDALVWTFPTDGRSFVLQRGIGWSQWMGWGPASSAARNSATISGAPR
jgi:hypothetical protein